MFKNYLFILLIVLIATVRSDLLEENDIVVDSNIQDDTIRILTYGDIGGSFYVAGASAEVSGSSSVSASTSTFFFSSGINSYVNLPLSYYYTYANTQVTPGSVSANGAVAAFVPSLVIEYEETNNKPGFQFDGDTVLGWVRLDKYDSFTINDQVSTISAKKDGKTISTKLFVINATSPDGLFSLRFTVAGAPVTIGGDISITSEQSKVDIGIDNYFDYTVNVASPLCSSSSTKFSCKSTGPSSNPNARLALATFFLTTSFDVDANINANTLAINGGDIDIDLTWVKTAQVNSTKSANVLSSVSASSNGKSFINAQISATYKGNLIVNSFDAIRPANVYFDPIIGGNGKKEPSSSSTITASITLIILSLISVLLL